MQTATAFVGAKLDAIPMTSAGPALEQKHTRRSASSFVMIRFSNRDDAVFVPRGKPNKLPVITAREPSFFMPNNFDMGAPIMYDNISAKFEDIISSFNIRKGNKDGISFVAQMVTAR